MHEALLIEVVIRERDRPLLDGSEDILHPGHEEPHGRAALGRDGSEGRLRRYASKEHILAAHKTASRQCIMAPAW